MVTLRPRTVASALLVLTLALLAVRPAVARVRPFTMVPTNPDAIEMNGTAMVPIRAVADIIGAELTTVNGLVTLRYNKATFACRFKRTAAMSNNTPIKLAHGPIVMSGVGYAPLRPLVTALHGSLTGGVDTVLVNIPTAPRLTISLMPEYWSYHMFWSPDQLYMVDLATGTTEQLSYGDTQRGLPSFDTDHLRCVYEREGGIYARTACYPDEFPVLRADDETHYPTTTRYHSPCYLPDGRMLYVKEVRSYDKHYDEVTTTAIYTINADGTQPHQLVEGNSPVLSGDGRLLAYVVELKDAKTEVHLRNLFTNADQLIGAGSRPCFSPAGDRLMIVRDYDRESKPTIQLLVFSTITGQQAAAVTAPDLTVSDSDEYGGAFTPDGKEVVYDSGGISLMNTDRKNARQLTLDGDDSDPTSLPDGSGVLFIRKGSFFDMMAGGTDSGDTLYIIGRDGANLRPLTHKLDVTSYAYAPDGKHVFVIGSASDRYDFLRSGMIARMISTFKESAPAFTTAEAQGYVSELVPLVEQVTGRKFKTTPAIKIVTRAEMAVAATKEMLPRLQRLMPDAASAELRNEAYQGGRSLAMSALGKYGTADKTLYLPAGNLIPLMHATGVDPALQTSLLKIVIAHELTHALQDQEVNLDGLFKPDMGLERLHGVAAAVEGHATWAAEQVAALLKLSPAAAELARAISTSDFQGLPELSKSVANSSEANDNTTIYLRGRDFMAYFAAHGGTERQWEVLAAPPATSRMIFHPETYSPTVPDTRIYRDALKGIEKLLGDQKWETQQTDIGEMELQRMFKDLDEPTRNALLAGIVHSETMTASSDKGMAAIAIIATNDPAIARRYINTMEAQSKSRLKKLQGDMFMMFGKTSFGSFTGAKGDLCRKMTISMSMFSDARVSNVIRVARGTTVVEIITSNLSLTDTDFGKVVEELFTRLTLAPVPVPVPPVGVPVPVPVPPVVPPIPVPTPAP
jgi:hypothetical protein